MNHLILLFICILSVEMFIRFNFLANFESILRVSKKVSRIIAHRKISDHWKEKIIPAYALKIMQNSLKILIIILCIISLFLFFDIFDIDLLTLTFSYRGIIESMIFAFGYAYYKKLIK
mgnify:FL=1